VTRADWINGAAAVGALALSIAVAAASKPLVTAPVTEPPPEAAAASIPPPAGTTEAGGAGSTAPAAAPGVFVDAGGRALRLRPFRRIVGGSSVADRLLLELCEHDRIVGLTEYGARYSPFGNQYAGKALITELGDTETLLALRPDLIIVNKYDDPKRIDRLREAGVEVFDLGEMRGVATLLPDIDRVGLLVGHPEHAAAFRRTFSERLARIAASLPAGARRSGMYITAYGDKLYGGTAGTNYHDVLAYGGVDDVAAARYRDWPEYSTEQVLALDPALVVTKPGMTGLLCRRPGFERLRACLPGGHIVEIAGALLDDPGPTMLDAAEAVYRAVYGSATP
jgi:iron complex transport system substrate-binding protein